MTLQEPPAQLLEQLSNPLDQDFDYAALDGEIQTLVKQRTSKIKTLMRRTASTILGIGQKLMKVVQAFIFFSYIHFVKIWTLFVLPFTS